MLSNLKVGTKLLAVAAAPLLLALVLTFIGIGDRRADADAAAETEQLVGFAGQTSALIGELQTERTATAEVLVGAGQADPTAFRASTDEAAAAYAAGRNGLSQDEELAAALDEAMVTLEGLEGIRARIDSGEADPSVIAEYSQIVGRLFTVLDEVAEQPELGPATNDVLSLVAVADAREAGAALRAQVALAFASEQVAPPVAAEIAALEDARLEASERLEQLPSDRGTEAVRQAQAEWPQGAALDDLMTLFRAATEAGAAGESDRGQIDTAIEGFILALEEAETTVATAALQDASSASGSASSNARNFMIIWLVAAVVSILLTLVLARALTRRLVRLTGAAEHLAEHQLPGLVERLSSPSGEGGQEVERPSPVDVHGTDEIGQLADAFNSIQDVTFDVAVEQGRMLERGISDIFVNLARRNQGLIDRQIQFIDDLEAREEDPDVLESLFRLDHLATRMRRHAESLLVLAGAEPTRRRNTPVSLADVVRVAVGEIEDYNRISLIAFDDAEVPSSAAVDVAHMLSELMENATQFSPPDTMVEIVGHRTTDGYTLSISDQGIGMAAEQLDDVNQLLANPPATGLTLNRTLGFVVIARLARRFSLKVRLTSSPSGGVTALVNIPGPVLVQPDEPAAAEPGFAPAAPGFAQQIVLPDPLPDEGAAPIESTDDDDEPTPAIPAAELPTRESAWDEPTVADEVEEPPPPFPPLVVAEQVEEPPPPFPPLPGAVQPEEQVEEPPPPFPPLVVAEQVEEPPPPFPPLPGAVQPEEQVEEPPPPFPPLVVAEQVEEPPPPFPPLVGEQRSEVAPLPSRDREPSPSPVAPIRLPTTSAEELPTGDWGAGTPLTPTAPSGGLPSTPAPLASSGEDWSALPSRQSDPPPLPPLGGGDTTAAPLPTTEYAAPVAGSGGFAPAESGQTPGGLPLWQPTFVPAEPDASSDDLTPAGLIRREPTAPSEGPSSSSGSPVTSTRRSPEEVRQMLSRYRGGLKKGRTVPDPDGNPPVNRPRPAESDVGE